MKEEKIMANEKEYEVMIQWFLEEIAAFGESCNALLYADVEILPERKGFKILDLKTDFESGRDRLFGFLKRMQDELGIVYDFGRDETGVSYVRLFDNHNQYFLEMKYNKPQTPEKIIRVQDWLHYHKILPDMSKLKAA